MLNENIKAIRKAKGLSQQELAVKLNIVRQTVSKWEQGLSVPDADLLICPVAGAGNACEHAAGRNSYGVGGGSLTSNF